MNLIERMLRIRTIEQEIAARYPQGKMRTPVHLSVGQEAAAVGVCAALWPVDQAVSTHRSHAHYLAMGGDLTAMLCELYGKAGGCSGAHGGSMHLVDRSVGFMGSTSIVGGTIPIGVGLAWAKKLRKEMGIVIVFHGDAACEQGVWHESVNFASLHALPVLFVCENNQYSCFTHINERQPRRPITQLAQAHGLRIAKTNSSDPNEIYKMAKSLREVAAQDGPVFFEIANCRYLEHCGPFNDDHLNYRDISAVNYWKASDPLNGMTPSPDVLQEIAQAFRLAESAPDPEHVSVYAE
jgi:TPP-dependent pyruvate/acetoin dehydrogenase alpha subunit